MTYSGPIFTVTDIAPMSCRMRSSGESLRNARAFSRIFSKRLRSLNSAKPATPGGSLRLRGFFIALVHVAILLTFRPPVAIHASIS